MAKRIIVCADCEGTPDQLERLWRAVERHDIKVNFFFTGETALENGDLVREIARTQNVDSHTFSHPNLRALSKARQRDEILRGKETAEPGNFTMAGYNKNYIHGYATVLVHKYAATNAG